MKIQTVILEILGVDLLLLRCLVSSDPKNQSDFKASWLLACLTYITEIIVIFFFFIVLTLPATVKCA